ncbi:MAG: hypothetical protein WAM42_11405 [Candidatus Nitrosopolaris sp.]
MMAPQTMAVMAATASVILHHSPTSSVGRFLTTAALVSITSTALAFIISGAFITSASAIL